MTELHLAIHKGSEIATDFRTVVTDGVIIGRDRSCGVWLPDPEVSRRHAMLLRSGPVDWKLRDLDSLNGTLIGDMRVVGDVGLPYGTKITISPYVISAFVLHERPAFQPDPDDESTQKSEPCRNGSIPRSPTVGLHVLTRAQRRVCQLLLNGLAEKEAANRLGISVHTVHDHTKSIYKALSVSSRPELILRYGIPPLPPDFPSGTLKVECVESDIEATRGSLEDGAE